MKRMKLYFVLFLTALCCTLMVSAESAIHSVTVKGNAVTVSVTAETDCYLFAALYEESGQLLDTRSADLFASAKRRTETLVFPDGVPEKAYAKAFLMDRNSHNPLGKSVSTRADDTPAPTPTPAPDSDVYAILYYGGELVFQHGDTPESGRGIPEIYAVDITKSYESSIDGTMVPWYEKHYSIRQVNFADTIRPISTAYWFYDCPQLQEVKNIKNLDTANVTDMHDMFAGCEALTTLDLSGFNTANVTDMHDMFAGCKALTTLDVSGFDTSNVTDMSYMFARCEALTTLDLSGFNTANVTNMYAMFDGCKALMTLDVSGFDTSNVTNMGNMFFNCNALTALDVSGFKTANVIYMRAMFHSCHALTTLDVSNFKTSNVYNTEYMFYGCHSLITIYVSGQFDISHVKLSSYMFHDCLSLVGGNGTTYDRNYIDMEYAHIDGGASNPGYFTAKT